MSFRWSVKEFYFISYFLVLINCQQLLAKRFPLPYYLPNICSLYSLPDHSLIAPQSNHDSFYPMLHLTLQLLMLLSGWRCIPFFLSLNFWSCAVEILTCIRGYKLEPPFKDSLSWSYSLFSAWIFKNMSHWESIRLTLQPQPTKWYASAADSRETSFSTYHLTKGKWSKQSLSFGSTFRIWPSISSLLKPSPSVSIMSTKFMTEGHHPLFYTFYKIPSRWLWENLNQEVRLRHLPHLLSQFFCLYWP